MRNVVNISLPEETIKTIKAEVKADGYASVSEFFRSIIRERNVHKLEKELKEDRLSFEAGKGKTLHSLNDLR